MDVFIRVQLNIQLYQLLEQLRKQPNDQPQQQSNPHVVIRNGHFGDIVPLVVGMESKYVREIDFTAPDATGL
jgi:hypothetical protein